jgi:MFS family permease
MADYRWRTTFAYCVIAFFRSAVQKMTGPALVPIGRQVGIEESDIGALGFATAASGCGYVFGAAVAGPLVDRLPGRQHGIVTCAVVIEAASTMLIPFATRLPVVATLLFVDGVGNGAMLPALTVSLVWIWGREVGPKMQLFSAMFLGTVMSTAVVGLDLELTATAEISDSGEYRHAFWGISAAQLLFCALPPLFMRAPTPPKHHIATHAVSDSGMGGEETLGLVSSDTEHDSDDASDEDKSQNSSNHNRQKQPSHSTTWTGSTLVLNSMRATMVVGHAGVIVFAYCVAESCIGTWLATFVFVKGLAGESVAALFVSAFWAGLVRNPIYACRRCFSSVIVCRCM